MRKITVAAAVFAVLWPGLACAQEDSQRVDSLVRDYLLCARRAAIRLEPAGDAPEDIARAATWVCANEEIAAVNAALKVPRQGMGPSDLRGAAVYAAGAQAVGARLCRKTKDCAYAHVP